MSVFSEHRNVLQNDSRELVLNSFDWLCTRLANPTSVNTEQLMIFGASCVKLDIFRLSLNVYEMTLKSYIRRCEVEIVNNISI